MPSAVRLRVERRDPSIEFRPLRASVADEHDHPQTQSGSALLIHQHAQELLELPFALRRDHSSLQQTLTHALLRDSPRAGRNCCEAEILGCDGERACLTGLLFGPSVERLRSRRHPSAIKGSMGGVKMAIEG